MELIREKLDYHAIIKTDYTKLKQHIVKNVDAVTNLEDLTDLIKITLQMFTISKKVRTRRHHWMLESILIAKQNNNNNSYREAKRQNFCNNGLILKYKKMKSVLNELIKKN